MESGLYLLHKPAGPTSFSLVRQWMEQARAQSPQKRPRVCHGGTLDPFAQGLLLMLVGPATRLFDYLHDIPKVYEATVRWGVETDNGDPHGKLAFTGDASKLTPQRLEDAVEGFLGWQEQTPPATSAKRIGGERAYEKAHRGEKVELPAWRVYLHEAQWIEHRLPEQSALRVVVRGGYYVRALVRDMGRLLGCGAHVASLERNAIGPWSDPGPGKQVAVRGAELVPWMPTRMLNDVEVGLLREGKSIAQGEVSPPAWRLPQGFPAPLPWVRGLHLGRLRFVLRAEMDRLLPASELGRGI